MFKKTYSISYPIEVSNENYFFGLTKSNYDALLSRLKFFIIVKEGELLYNPRFGFGFEKYLNEPMNPELVDKITQDLKNKVKEFFPSIEIRSIQMDLSDSYRVITLRVDLLVNGVNDSLAINF